MARGRRDVLVAVVFECPPAWHAHRSSMVGTQFHEAGIAFRRQVDDCGRLAGMAEFDTGPSGSLAVIALACPGDLGMQGPDLAVASTATSPATATLVGPPRRQGGTVLGKGLGSHDATVKQVMCPKARNLDAATAIRRIRGCPDRAAVLMGHAGHAPT